MRLGHIRRKCRQTAFLSYLSMGSTLRWLHRACIPDALASVNDIHDIRPLNDDTLMVPRQGFLRGKACWNLSMREPQLSHSLRLCPQFTPTHQSRPSVGFGLSHVVGLSIKHLCANLPTCLPGTTPERAARGVVTTQPPEPLPRQTLKPLSGGSSAPRPPSSFLTVPGGMGEDTAQSCLHTASRAVGPLGPHVTHAVGTSQQGNNPFAAASLVEGMPRSGFRGMKVEGGLVSPGGTEG